MATWGTLTWSTGNWGDQTNSTVSLTGIGASSNLGSVTTTSTVEFGWGRDLWSSRAWGSPSQIVLLGSFDISANLGDETTAGEINAGWGRLTWGENAWGEQGDVVLSGIAMSASLGDESTVVDVSPTLTGIPMTASQGDESVEISFEITPTAIAMSANLGTADAGPDAMLQGIGFSANVGTLEAYNLEGWGRYFWGQFEWGATGEWEFVTPTSIEMSAAINPDGVPTFTALADAQLSNTQSKFGDTSLKLDGSSDRIQSTDITLGTESYTWETFAYFNSFASTQCIWDAGENVGASQNPVVFITPTNIQISYAGGTYINVAHGMSTGQWHHIAIVRNGTGTGNLKAYIDGVNVGTGNLGSLGSGATNHVLGGNFAGTFTMNGFLDESRLTKSVVYTGNFTPPTSEFSVSSDDIWLLHYDGANASTDIFNSALNQYTITGTGNTDVTGIAMTATEGDVDPSPDATVTGIGFGMAVATGTVVSGSADVTVVGEGFSAALGTGTLDAVTFADATAIAMTANLGTIANVTGNANVTPTGIELTMALNSANALIWNEVNTGSAPIDPPGWQEVPTRAA